MADIRIKRAYRAARVSDGRRILVDRVWPRSVARDRLQVAEWMQEIAPSAELRRWFGHKPERWAAFKAVYWDELDARSALVAHLYEYAAEGSVTLVYGARDEQHNNAVALKDYLDRRLVKS
ncbi:uroporphyrin-III C-methyltransferase [Defluviimonas sp. 20V17]|uniref:Uncharacterized conserved protein YeaO, DUF488 family n=1 Tax=Allgaiera indica TaxID=765699 RepID=A0AAN4UUY2_9RHOB|nr:DUF488 family protein [Allgaiera indica]KDB04146.1 uroporphyrin-III C-methyltransferase [Defluviimonas sp. 20V17]GHE06079.1 hypothetical protein GCM10008024_39310 [Allgaiera indica]SDX84369.1 Uncharacterized conserved protein YeaO, DUF488 family [Allgaiera indica]